MMVNPGPSIKHPAMPLGGVSGWTITGNSLNCFLMPDMLGSNLILGYQTILGSCTVHYCAACCRCAVAFLCHRLQLLSLLSSSKLLEFIQNF